MTRAHECPAEEDEKRVDDKSVHESKIGRRTLSAVWICSSAMHVGLGGYVGIAIANKQNGIENPSHPEKVYSSFIRFGREALQHAHIIKCPEAPGPSDIDNILKVSRELYDLRAEPDFDRFEIAKSLELDLVQQEDLDILQKEIDQHHHDIDRLNVISNDFTVSQFGIAFQFIPNINDSNHKALKTSDYSKKLKIFLNNLAVIPKELFTIDVLDTIVIDANNLKNHDNEEEEEALESEKILGVKVDREAFTPGGKFYWYGNKITLSVPNMTNPNTLIHELIHAVDARLCTENRFGDHTTFNSERAMKNLNPEGYGYIGSMWDDSDKYNNELFVRRYSQRNGKEDMADSGTSWVMQIDIDKFKEGQVAIVDVKQLVAANWLNNIAPNLAEYMSQISRHFMQK